GTIEYLSPEGCEGKRLDERADIWAFGVILFEMLSGERPFKGETLPSILTSILSQPAPDLSQYRSDIPRVLTDLVRRMVVKDPDQRLPSVRLVGAELEAIMADRPMTPVTPIAPAIPAGPPPACPYRGLFAFREEDAPFFFGREEFTRQLIEAAQRQALIAVVGSSGSGKSSVVLAGLLAHLLQKTGWIVVKFRPGSDPFQSLAGALLPLLEPGLSEIDQLAEIRKLAQRLARAEIPLVDI
ncbi:MAG: protein kinase, partial [Planctomycetales bacterium]|nr:protein kinase [Planctomycetales bacterium]NIP70297.1 protein kinase [Planctomycetales bacterium]